MSCIRSRIGKGVDLDILVYIKIIERRDISNYISLPNR